MSGGHYNYQYHALGNLADDIERDFVNGGTYTPEYNYSLDGNEKGDLIGDANEHQRPVILQEVRKLIADLRACGERARELEWYLSGDTGADSYLKRLYEKHHISSYPAE